MKPGPSAGRQDQPWAIVLAGGEGVRLQPLIRRIYGQSRPKQFSALFGGRSLLRQTLDRVRMVAAPDRTVVVTVKSQASYLEEALDGVSIRRVLTQPEDKGTGAGVLLPCQWIHGSDPDGIAVVFPSDHFVAEEETFMDQVADMVEVVKEHPEWIVLMGAVPSDPEPDYGWIEPGDVVAWSSVGGSVNRVHRFWEKPSPLAARACLEKGWLWNTFIFAARVSRILDVASQFLARLHEQFSLVISSKNTEVESRVLEQAYGLTQKTSFSRSVLELCPASLVVSRLPDILWSDWGTQERVLKSLRRAGLLPSWFDVSDLRAAPVEGR
jgi:mannose-1-phosphate guanylyltransferase